MSDDSPYVSLEDEPQAGDSPYVSFEDESAPQPMRQMPDKVSEANYQGWVQAHTKDGQFHTPGMADRTVGVDPYGNGVDVDLRAAFLNHAPKVPVPQQPDLDLSEDMLNRYATPNANHLTADSIYAKGVPASRLGTWGTDEDGLSEYHPPGWQPATTTSRIMAKASDLADKAYESASALPGEVAADFRKQAAGGIPRLPLPTSEGNQGPALAEQAVKAFARGSGAAVDSLNYVAAQPGGVPWMYDSVKGLLTGEDTSEAEDWFKDGSTYFKSRKDAYEVAKSAGLAGELADAVGSTGAAINQALLLGPAKTVEASASLIQRAVDALSPVARSAIIPGVSSAIQTGRDVYEKTGNAAAAIKAAQADYLSTVLQFAAPIGTSGGILRRAVTGAAVMPASAEAGREIMNAAMPADMQTPYEAKQSVIAGVTGGLMAAGMGHSPAPAEEPPTSRFNVDDMMARRGGEPVAGLPPSGEPFSRQDSYDNYERARKAATAGDTAEFDAAHETAEQHAKSAQTYADAHPGDAQAQADAKDARQMADAAFWDRYRTQAQGNAEQPAPGSAGERRQQQSSKVSDIVSATKDPADIDVEHMDGGSIVTVGGKDVAAFDTKGAANSAVTAAKQELRALPAPERIDNVSTPSVQAPEATEPEKAAEPSTKVLGQDVTPPAEPTPAQAEAGNYRKPEVEWNGLPIKVENLANSTRKGIGADGKPFERTMTADYGYFPGTKSTDGEGVDVLMGTDHEAPNAFVIDQLKKDGSFDEPKVVVGVRTDEEARALYHEQYPANWKGFGGITQMSQGAFKSWLKDDAAHQERTAAERAQPTTLYRGTETGTAGVRRESLDGEMGRGIYATPSKRLAASYGGGPKARVGAGRDVHELSLPKLSPEQYGYVEGGSREGEKAKLVDHTGTVLHEFDGTKISGREERRQLRAIADKAGMKVLVGEKGSIGENQVAILDQNLISTKVEQPGAEAQTIIHGNEPVPAAGLPEGGSGGAEAHAAAGDGNREPLDERVAEGGESPPSERGVPPVSEGAGEGREERLQQPGEPAPGEARDRGTVRPEPEAADAGDHRLSEEELAAKSHKAKYDANVAAVKILKAMEAEKRLATPEERSDLAKYVGWGALKGVFDHANKQWAKQYAELKSLLTEDEYKAARASTLNAHYTSKPVVKAIYDALEHMGFDEGRILEPAVGTGNFFGLMPPEMRAPSQLHGVELDPLTAKIAQALYPSAKITQGGFQDFDVPAGYFDATVGNPPFGSEPIVDTARSPYSGTSIHNYFLSKAIDKLRPGGLMSVVVSHNFLDAKNDRTRKWIAERADLVGAARLPDTAFKDNAGTEVVTDILVFQKRAEGTKGNGADWIDTVDQVNKNPKTDESFTHSVNKYMAAHPENVLGEPSAAGTMYRPGEYTVSATGELPKQLAQWVKTLPEDIYSSIERGPEELDAADVAIPDGIKVGSYFIDEKGELRTRTEDQLGKKRSLPWVAPNAKALERVTRMVGLRDQLRQQMRMERSPEATNKAIEANRKKLNTAYDQFKAKYGLLNNQTNRKLFLDDPESPLLLALEFDYDRGISEAVAERTGVEPREPKATKADILKQRVLFPPADSMKVSSAKDALLASLNYKGTVDPKYMASIYDKSQAEIEKELGDVVFRDPHAGLVTADEYLSGDVKTKLLEAEAAGLKKNVAALEKVIPADKLPSQIHATLGTAFVPENVYGDFYKQITGAPHEVKYVPAVGQWFSSPKGQTDEGLNRGKFGTKDITAKEILDKTMAGQAVLITRTIRHSDGSTETIVMQNETELARAKQDAIKEEWQRWLWEDAERADKVAAIYNEKLNRIVNRKYDGTHMTFPGMSPAITLLDHQKNGVWRGLQSRQVLYDHVVGAGKTFAMATLAMEMRRLGISRKPMLAVPNHLTGQWRSEFSRLYPSSYILVAEPEDFTKGNREKFFSKITTGDWDAVIVGHSSLKKIALPPETERRILTDQMRKLTEAIEEMKRARGDRNIIRDMEGIKARLEARFQTKMNKLGERDKAVSFDELGVDSLMVDELHEFKNLFYSSTMAKAAGMGNPTGSDKAFDLFVKLRWLNEAFGDKAPIVGATGTPVSNSLVEMYNMQRFMQYPTLENMGLDVFDAWAKQFGNMESVYEVSPSGTGWRNSTRFQKFANLPALMSLYKTMADTITLDDLKAQEAAQGKTFPVPKLATGAPINVVAPRSKEQETFMGTPKLQLAADGLPLFDLPLHGEGRVVELRTAKNEQSGKFHAEAAYEGDPERFGTLGEGFETPEDAQMGAVQKAMTPKLGVAPESILGQFENLKQLMRQTKGKVNALSITGAANKAGLDYRLIDPHAKDFPDSKINKAVDRIVEMYHRWSKDKGTQLVFCDLSVPLSARAAAGAVPAMAYLRKPDGSLMDKRATMHTVAGHENIPYFLVERGVKAEKRVDLYDAASGALVNPDFENKAAAHVFARQALNDDEQRANWHLLRTKAGEISQDAIDAYNNEQQIDPEETNSHGREDIAGMSGSSKFSVYDDIKTKLVKAGIPAREIAFIHDYHTPSAKQKLFGQVNSGDIRILLGSTPKMGAGTNVQKRIVALHHIDAPWRPSDLEQRNGRMVRRGNELYERDPKGFEVTEYRYATSQTYDTRRWQILEHKARGIEQLRNYDSSLNEIEDIEGQAASAADMKAAASGDPLILEETKTKNEVQALERLQKATADEQAANRAKARNLRERARNYLPDQKAKIERQIKTADAHPAVKDGFTPIEFSNETYTSKESFAKDAAAIVEMMRRGEQKAPVVIQYRGLRFTLAPKKFIGETVIHLDGPDWGISAYGEKDPFSPAGLITRLSNYVEALPSRVEEIERTIENSLANADQAEQASKVGFAKQAELDAAREAYRKVRAALMAKGPPVSEEEKPLLSRGIAAQRQGLKDIGLGERLHEYEHATTVNEDQARYEALRRKQAGVIHPGVFYEGIRRSVLLLAKDNAVMQSIQKLVNPKDVSATSKQTAQITTAFLGELARQKAEAQEHLEQFARAIDGLSPKDQLAITDAIERQLPQPMKGMQPAADAMRKIQDHWRDQVRALGTGHLENYIEGYMKHMWRDEAKAGAWIRAVMGRSPLRGPATFLKKRTIPYTTDGIAMGLKPVTYNPLVLTLVAVHEMQRYISGVTMFNHFKSVGLAQFLRAGHQMPEGWARIDDYIARVQQWSEAEKGFITRGEYIMPEDAARIINNHLSASKLKNFAPAQIIRVGSNILNSVQLGFSAFHLGFTTLDAMVSKNAIGIERLLHGEPGRAAMAFIEASTPVGAALNIRRGYKLLQSYLNPAGATPEMKQLVQALAAGGGRIRMDRYFMANEHGSPFRGVGFRSLAQDIRAATNGIEVAKAIGHFPIEYAQKFARGLQSIAAEYPWAQVPFEILGRIVRASSALIMEHIVPMQKLGVFSDLASDWLRRNPTAPPDEMVAAMQSIWRSVDNRLGEMVYDNKFWDRTFKDSMHLAVRAVGWNDGTLEEIGGAPVDFLKAVDKLIKTGRIKGDDWGHKIPYVMGLMMTVGIIGSLLNYLMTGEWPKDLKDVAFPRTGRLHKDGTPARLSLPSYVKDIYEYWHHPGQTIAHKANPWISITNDLIQGNDYFGDPIYNPDGDALQHFRDGLDHIWQAARPFSGVFGGQQRSLPGAEEPGITGDLFKVAPFVGVTNAPGVVTKPEKIAETQHYYEERAWEKKLKYQLKQAQEKGDQEEIARLRKDLAERRRADKIERNEYKREKRQGEERYRQSQKPTSQLLDHIGPLIDGASSRAEMAEKIHEAGYPALAGLIGSLPQTMRPQVMARLQEYA